MTTEPAERLRRPSEEVQGLILESARELFQVKGYSGTTTKEIAGKAGVAEALLFTNFGSKSQLFERSIAGPFDEFVDDYIRGWQEMPGNASESERLEGFIRGLLDLTESNRGLLADAIAPPSGGPSRGGPPSAAPSRGGLPSGVPPSALPPNGRASRGAAADAREMVIRAVSRAIQRVHALDHGPHPWTFEPTTILAATTGMVMSTVLLDRFLFTEDGPPPEREVLIRELTRFMLYGLAGPADQPRSRQNEER